MQILEIPLTILYEFIYLIIYIVYAAVVVMSLPHAASLFRTIRFLMSRAQSPIKFYIGSAYAHSRIFDIAYIYMVYVIYVYACVCV